MFFTISYLHIYKYFRATRSTTFKRLDKDLIYHKTANILTVVSLCNWHFFSFKHFNWHSNRQSLISATANSEQASSMRIKYINKLEGDKRKSPALINQFSVPWSRILYYLMLYGKDGWAISMNTGMWSGINMICPDLATSTKSFSFATFFLFFIFISTLPTFFMGAVKLPGIHWDYLQTQFPTQHFTLQTWNGLLSLICQIFLKCRIGGEQLQLILRKTGTTDPGIHTKRKSTIKRKYPRKSTTKESIKEKNTIKSRILQTSH